MKQSFCIYRCKIKIIPLFVVICLLVLLFRLGFWQLNRAEETFEFNMKSKEATYVAEVDRLLFQIDQRS